MSTMAECSYLRPATPEVARKRPRVHPLKFSEVGLDTDRRQVYLRIKPKQKKQKATPFVALDNTTLVPTLNEVQKSRKGILQQFKFTNIFGPKCEQEQVFKETCFSPISDFVSGKNCLIFAYGATNAGKTFTIQGSQDKPGIIPRALNLLFNTIKDKISEEIECKPDKINNVVWLKAEELDKELETKQSILNFNFERTLIRNNRTVSASSTFSNESNVCSSSNNDVSNVCPFFRAMKTHLDDEIIELGEDSNNVYSVWVSYAEIYNENIYDLLQPDSRLPRKPLIMGENANKDVYIKGLTDVCVLSAEEAFKVFMYGKHNLHEASTNINHVSSRSHSIFTIKLLKHLNIGSSAFVQLSMCTFVDLAGTERAKKTNNAGERMKESQCINTSLHVLGKCLDVLRHKQKTKEPNRRMLPCRESKLTRLFQRALEGRETLTMIVNINQDENLFDETMNVLKFSAIAMELQFDRVDNSTVCSLRKSSFSTYMEKYSTSFQSSVNNIEEVPEDERYMKLLVYIEELKKSLEEEKKKNLTLEVQVRKEVYAHCKKIMRDMEDMHRKRLQNEKNIYSEHEVVTTSLYRKYIEERCKRSREDDSEDDDEGDSEEERNNDDESEDYEDRIKFLENKVEALSGHVEASNQLKLSYTALQTKHSKLQFEMASVKQELKKASKLNECINLGEDNVIVKELQTQLSEQKNLLQERNKEIEDLKKLLENAKSEYDEHFREHEDFAIRNAELEKVIADHELKIDDLQSQLTICNKRLAQQQQHVNDRELEEVDFASKLQHACEARDEFKFKVVQLETEVKKLKREKESLQSQPKNTSISEMRALEALVASHEDLIQKYEEKLKSQQEANKVLNDELSLHKTSSICSNQDSYEKEINLLQTEVKETAKTKKELFDKIEKINKEFQNSKEALRLAEVALEEEQSNTKAIRTIYDAEKDKLTEELQNMKDAWLKIQKDYDQVLRERDDLKLQNLEFEETIKAKEDEMEGFKSRRNAQFDMYENMLKHEKEVREREQREVHQIQNVLRTLTPQKNEQLMHITKLKDELKEAYMTISELKKESRLTVDPLYKTKTRRNRKAQNENIPIEANGEVGAVGLPEIPIKQDPEEADCGRQLRPRRKKILFTNDDSKDEIAFRPKSSRRRP